MVEKESDVEVVISSDTTPEDHIKATNKLLYKFCNQNGWALIKHNSITKEHLNDGGLHLSDQGNSIIANNSININMFY